MILPVEVIIRIKFQVAANILEDLLRNENDMVNCMPLGLIMLNRWKKIEIKTH